MTLSPGSFEFKTDLGKNRIDYYFLEGEFRYQNDNYRRLQNNISAKIEASRKTAYQFHSIYIYKKTTELNSKYTSGKEGLDGHNKDLIAYIRYKQDRPDLFYLIKDGVIVFDLLAQEKTNFEFDE